MGRWLIGCFGGLIGNASAFGRMIDQRSADPRRRRPPSTSSTAEVVPTHRTARHDERPIVGVVPWVRLGGQNSRRKHKSLRNGGQEGSPARPLHRTSGSVWSGEQNIGSKGVDRPSRPTGGKLRRLIYAALLNKCFKMTIVPAPPMGLSWPNSGQIWQSPGKC